MFRLKVPNPTCAFYYFIIQFMCEYNFHFALSLTRDPTSGQRFSSFILLSKESLNCMSPNPLLLLTSILLATSSIDF